MSHQGQLEFRMRDAFPPDDPVAVFVMVFSTAFRDVVRTTRWLAGGDEHGPDRVSVSDADQLYLLRLSIQQLMELRETVRHARKEPGVAAYVDALSPRARAAIDLIHRLDFGEDKWVKDALTHVRNQTVHYGGKWSFADAQWAMGAVAAQVGRVEFVTDTFAGLHLHFTDDVVLQHLSRKIPEHATLDANPSDEVLRDRLSTLFKAVASLVRETSTFAEELFATYFGNQISLGRATFQPPSP